MEDMMKLGEKYKLALESIKEVKSQLSSVIIRYLLLNSSELKKCTELAISDNLGISRGTVRRVLSDLTPPNEPVLECQDLGTIKPYAVASIGYAIDKGHVSFSKNELQEVLSIKESPTPVSELAADTSVFGGRRYLTPGAAKCYDTFAGRFYSYLPAAEINSKLRKAYPPEKQEELELLLPELSTFNSATGIHAIVPSWSSSELTFLGNEATPKEIQEGVKRRWEREIGYVLSRLEAFASYLEELGYRGTVEKFGRPKVQIDHIDGPDFPTENSELKREYLWTTTMALRNGCKIAEKLGVERTLLKRAMHLSDLLDKAVEKEYAGKEKGGTLEEWYRNQA